MFHHHEFNALRDFIELQNRTTKIIDELPHIIEYDLNFPLGNHQVEFHAEYLIVGDFPHVVQIKEWRYLISLNNVMAQIKKEVMQPAEALLAQRELVRIRELGHLIREYLVECYLKIVRLLQNNVIEKRSQLLV